MERVEQIDWCFGVVGNIVKTHLSEDGTLRYGTSAFRGGARVFLDGKNWKDSADQISVIGFSRGNRYQIVEVSIALIENVRCCRILTPAVLELIHHSGVMDGWTWWGRTAADKRETEAFVTKWNHMRLEKLLSGEVRCITISRDGAWQWNKQSCDCLQVFIMMKDHVLCVEHQKNGEDGTIRITICPPGYEPDSELLILPPPDGKIVFEKVRYFEDGQIDAVKYRYADRYLYLFSSEYELIVTKSIPDLLEEDDTPIPEIEDSVLFDNLH